MSHKYSARDALFTFFDSDDKKIHEMNFRLDYLPKVARDSIIDLDDGTVKALGTVFRVTHYVAHDASNFVESLQVRCRDSTVTRRS